MTATPAVFIPALLCDGALYQDVITHLGAAVEAHVMVAPKPTLAANVADILAAAPPKFALVGTSYGGNLALEVALAAPERVTALWLMGCDPAEPQPGGPDIAGGLEATPDAVIEMLSGLVVHKDATAAADTFKAMAKRVGGTIGAAQARVRGTRTEATSRLDALHMPALVLWGPGRRAGAGGGGPQAGGHAATRAFPRAEGLRAPADAGKAGRGGGAVRRVPAR